MTLEVLKVLVEGEPEESELEDGEIPEEDSEMEDTGVEALEKSEELADYHGVDYAEPAEDEVMQESMEVMDKLLVVKMHEEDERQEEEDGKEKREKEEDVRTEVPRPSMAGGAYCRWKGGIPSLSVRRGGGTARDMILAVGPSSGRVRVLGPGRPTRAKLPRAPARWKPARA